MKIPKRKIKKIKEVLKRLPKNLCQRAFLTFFGFFLIILILGSFIFYKYSILEEQREPQILKRPAEFDEKKYQRVLDFWEEREEKFKQIEFKEYPNPFKGLTEE